MNLFNQREASDESTTSEWINLKLACSVRLSQSLMEIWENLRGRDIVFPKRNNRPFSPRLPASTRAGYTLTNSQLTPFQPILRWEEIQSQTNGKTIQLNYHMESLFVKFCFVALNKCSFHRPLYLYYQQIKRKLYGKCKVNKAARCIWKI